MITLPPESLAGVLDALPLRIAVVDETGTIVAVNAAWREFASRNGGDLRTCGVGANYLAVCEESAAYVPEAVDVAEGLRAVLRGERSTFEQMYPCHGPVESAWFRQRIALTEAGSARVAVISHDDVSALKATTTALHQSVRRYAALANTSPDAVLLCRGDRLVFANRGLLALVGADAESEILGRSPLDLFHADDRAAVRERLDPALADATHTLEARLVRLDGRAIPVDVVMEPGAEADEIGLHVVVRDITQRKGTLEALATERQRLAALLSAIPDYVWMKDEDGRFLFGNPAFAALIGATGTEYVGQRDEVFVGPEQAAEFRSADRVAVLSDRPTRIEEWIADHVSGRRICLETIRAAVRGEHGQLLGVLGIARNITELRETEEALRRREREMRLALDAADLGTWQYVLETAELFQDERAGRHTALGSGAHPLSAFMARVHPDDRSAAERTLTGQLVEASEDAQVSELRVRHRDGSERWLIVHARVLFEGEGSGRHATRVFGTTQDVTQRNMAEQAVARFMAASPSVIYALDVKPTGLTLKWSSGNEEAFTGWTHAEASVPGWWAANLHPDDRARVLAASHAPLDTPHQVLEFRFLCRDGSYKWIRDEKRLVRSPEGLAAEIVGSWTDITSRIRLEDQLRQSQKLEAIGQLAGGIAHDFNNLLTVISGNSELLAQQFPAGTSERERINEVRDAGRRAARLTRQLLAFSRSQLLAPRVIALNDMVQQVEAMLKRLIGEDIRLTCRLSPEAGFVKVDPGQLEQVIINLAVNARDAMPGGGQLIIETASVMLDEGDCGPHTNLTPGCYARLTVTDTGSGIAPAVRAKLFEPFFTTKAPGKGTGLGLSTVFGIVKQSGGHIDVESEPGAGASFRVLLPPVQAASSTGAEAQQKTLPLQGHETVLIVEDEESVRRLARLTLERHGYKVLVAGSGSEALELAGQHGEQVDLVVTDVVMPGMSGRQLVDVLRGRWPGMKTLFMSGYVQDALERHDVTREPFLHKPFTLAGFTAAVRAVLDGRRAPDPPSHP